MIAFGNKFYTIDFFAIDKLVTDGLAGDKEEVEIEDHCTLMDVEVPVEGSDEVELKQDLVVTSSTIRRYPKSKQIDAVRYEMIKGMLDIVLNEPEEVDEDLGVQTALEKYSLSFKIAFNTLLYYGIIKTVKNK